MQFPGTKEMAQVSNAIFRKREYWSSDLGVMCASVTTALGRQSQVVDSRSSLASHSSQNSELRLQNASLFQNLKWRVTEKCN